MSLGFRVNNVIYPKSSGKIWGKYKNVIDTSRQLYYIFKGILDIKDIANTDHMFTC